MSLPSHKIISVLIVIIGAVLFIPFLGKVHLFDWDEVNFAESAREMLLSGNYLKVQINYQTFWEKPPLFIWLEAISMYFFGVNEFAARFPNAIIGIITLLILFNIGRKVFDKNFGVFWALAYAGSFLPHFYFKSGIIDPTFNILIFLGIYFIYKVSLPEASHKKGKISSAVLAGLFLGLAVLTKGPVALLISGLTVLVFMIVKRSIGIFPVKETLVFSASLITIASSWFLVMLMIDGPFFVTEFIDYQIRLFNTKDAGHGGPFFYHFLVLLIGCFPASLYVFKAFRKHSSDNLPQREFKIFMIISLLVVLILFSIVKTKIVHYSSFCYFPITFLAAYTIHKLHIHKMCMDKYLGWLAGFLGSIVALVLICLPLLMKNLLSLLPLIKPYIKDDFALANLQAQVRWTGWESGIGLFFLLSLMLFLAINKKSAVRASMLLFISSAITLQLVLTIIVPKVEGYVQATVMNFYKSLKGQDVYVEVYGFKSFAHLFYFDKKPAYNPKSLNEAWLREGDVDKPVYFVSKVTNKDLNNYPNVRLLKSENGFNFYRREVPSKK
jgi:4-amino-4-deoxy-L-arabinose transferase-like glycosyltransferase